MIYRDDKTIARTKSFTAQIQTLDIPGEIKPGYSPVSFIRCGRSAAKLVKILWKKGAKTGKEENPHSLKSNEAAECVFEPCQALVADTFKNCEGLSRVAFLDGNNAVMLGKVIEVTVT